MKQESEVVANAGAILVKDAKKKEKESVTFCQTRWWANRVLLAPRLFHFRKSWAARMDGWMGGGCKGVCSSCGSIVYQAVAGAVTAGSKRLD